MESDTALFSSDIQQDNRNFAFFALNILKTLAKKLFKNDRAVFCLTKSDTFLKELLNIFNGLYASNITPEKFFEVTQKPEFSDTDRQRLVLCAKLYKEYLKVMRENSYKIPEYKTVVINKAANENNLRSMLASAADYECLGFSDVQDECLHITQEIKNAVENNQANYSDFAIFADRSQMRQKILDMLKASNLPVITSIYNEQYENLKYKISLYHKICNVFESLGIEEFNSDSIKNPKITSKAEKEILFAQSDELLNTLVSHTVTDTSALDGVFASERKKSFTEALFGYIHLFNETDRELINKEMGLLARFYGFYVQKNYAKAIGVLVKNAMGTFEHQEIKDTAAKKLVSLEELQKLYDDVLTSEPDFGAFSEIMEWAGIDRTYEKNAVTLEPVSLLKNGKKTFKYLYIAGLTQNNFPGANSSYPFISLKANEILTDELKKLNPEFDGFLTTDESYNAKRLTCLFDILSRAEQKITLTSHCYEAKKNVQPSSVFTKAAGMDQTKFRTVEPKNYEQAVETAVPSGAGVKAQEKIIAPSDVLKLNASAISTFQNCPRKYYYKNLLNLKEPYTFSASYGSIVHAVFEVMNRRFLENYTKETALELAKVLFDSVLEPENAIKAGFKDTDIELVKAADRLSLEEMKDNFFDAIDDFSMSGGFDNPPAGAVCEQSFTFRIEELPNVVFDGRIDAILTDKNGNISIVDYKTGRDKTNTLDYAISEYGVNFKSRTGKDPSNVETLQNAYDYQIPLYYLACQNSEELAQYKDKLSSLGLVYIRPKSKDNGCSEDFVSAEKIAFYKDKIIENLKKTVIDRIVNETEFKQNKTFACDNCAYKFLCDGGDEDE